MDRPVDRSARSLAGASLLIVVALLASCETVPSRPSDGARDEATSARLLGLHRARDFFALDSLLAASPELDTPLAELMRAEVAHAFNRPERSNAILASLETRAAELPDSLRVSLYRLKYRNSMRLHDYPRALASATTLLATTRPDSARRARIENEVRLLEAVRDVPPQRVVRRDASIVHRRPDTRVPVRVADSTRAYVFDTGANVSAMMRSEAEALGLEIREAAVEVGSVTGARITADVAVADRFGIGEVELANVVFLVMPDSLLTFDDGEFTIPGIVGFPVVEALGEIAFRGGEELRVPAEVPRRPIRNLALDFLDPRIRVRAFGETHLCRLDTGAGDTDFYLPFHRRHRETIESIGRRDSVASTGVGGTRSLPAYVLPEIELAIGDTTVVLEDRPVYTISLDEEDDEVLDCNVGLDVLRSFREYVVNFRSMTFLLR